MRSICPRPTPSSTCLTLTPCHGRGGCRERSVTLPTKRCWHCWGRYILYELGRIGRLGRLGRFSLMVYFAHKVMLVLLGKVHISSLGGGSPFLFSLLTLLAPHSSLLTPHSSLHHPLLLPSPYSSSRINVCITGVGEGAFPDNQSNPHTALSLLCSRARDAKGARRRRGEGEGGRSYSARVCVIVSVTPLSSFHPRTFSPSLPLSLFPSFSPSHPLSPSLTLSHLQCNTATGRDREHDTKPIYRRPPGCHHLGGYEAVNSGRTLK